MRMGEGSCGPFARPSSIWLEKGAVLAERALFAGIRLERDPENRVRFSGKLRDQ
jgi:hypothetical protein